MVMSTSPASVSSPPSEVSSPPSVVSSPVKERTDFGWGEVVARIDLEPEYWGALTGLESFSHAIVVTYLHQARFDPARHLKRRPRGRRDLPELGILAQRAKNRPNPIGGSQVEGNILRPQWASFVGPYPLPMRHGFTLGELARHYNATQKLGCDLEVVPARGWSRGDYFEATGLPWVLPSPNLPTLESAVVYPGQVLLEGTNLSEGRGTTRPFELFGAPFLEPARINSKMAKIPLPGVILREAFFEPTFHKWAGELCRGFQLHVTDRRSFKPYFTTLALLGAIRELYPDHFAWRQPPYEYETERLPIDLLTGDAAIREGLDKGTRVQELEAGWQKELGEFLDGWWDFLIYEE